MSNEHKVLFKNPKIHVYTKDFFFEAGEILLQLAKRNQVPLLVAVMDIDNYQKIDQEYGNGYGERVLELTTKLINDTSRSSDLVAYIGEGKLGIVFYNITKENATKTLESLCSKVASNTYVLDNKEHHITVSIGGSIMHSRMNAGSIELIYEQACLGVETAQRKGKNCVAVY